MRTCRETWGLDQIETERGNVCSPVNSFSIIMWEMLTGQQAWVTLDYKQMVAAVLRDRKRPPVPPDTNKDCKELLDQCWAQDPNDRPTFTAIVVALQAFKLLPVIRCASAALFIHAYRSRCRAFWC